MSELHSALYRGTVVHRRHRPKAHTLKYQVFYLLLDLDEVENGAASVGPLRLNKRGFVSFRHADHGPGEALPLRPWVEGELAKADVRLAGGRIQLMCFPRVAGYVFNPLSVYFCYDHAGVLAALLYEVTNTFKERHTYVIPVNPCDKGVIEQACGKEMYVSPFITLDSRYAFKVLPPADRLAVAIRQSDAEGVLLDASFTGNREPLNSGTLRAALARFPLITVKVIAAIHWEALKLWLKRIPPVARAPAPETPTSIIRTGGVPPAQPAESP